MKDLLVALIIFFLATSGIEADRFSCEKCDLSKVMKAGGNMESLTLLIVSEFLCTLDKSCRWNAADWEIINETLYRIFDRSPKLVFEAIKEDSSISLNQILLQLENPSLDYNYEDILDKIERIELTHSAKSQITKAIRIGSTKEGGVKLD